MARKLELIDPKIAPKFMVAKKENKKLKKILVTRIHPNKVKEYEKAGWIIEEPVDYAKMPDTKAKDKKIKELEKKLAELEAAKVPTE